MPKPVIKGWRTSIVPGIFLQAGNGHDVQRWLASFPALVACRLPISLSALLDSLEYLPMLQSLTETHDQH
jgi:hypothetical protein